MKRLSNLFLIGAFLAIVLGILWVLMRLSEMMGFWLGHSEGVCLPEN